MQSASHFRGPAPWGRGTTGARPYVTYRLLVVWVWVLLAVGLVGCQPQGRDLPTVEPSKTPRPTFTPPATTSEPTLAPTITPKPQAAASATAPQPTAMVTAAGATPLSQVTATVQPSRTPVPPTPTQRPPTATPAPAAKPLRMKSPEYGMQVFPWWRPEVASRDFQLVRQAGFTWAKVGFGWRDIEVKKGVFDWSRTDLIVQMAGEQGLDLVVRVDHQPAWAGGGFPLNGPPDNLQDLADFLTALVSRYKGRIRAYEVWNEPNLAREWGGQVPDPGNYAKLLRVAYRAIKQADPNAMVISAGLSPTGTWNEEARPDDWYLESLYIAMGKKSDGYFDVLGVHGAGFKSPPERDPAEVAANKDLGGQRAFCFRHVEDLRAIMVKYGDGNKQIALLEFGWTSDPRPDSPYHWFAVSEEVKADYLVRAYQYAKTHWSPWIGLMSLIYICDPDWTESHEQYWWAITYPSWPEFKPRPAYLALQAMPK